MAVSACNCILLHYTYKNLWLYEVVHLLINWYFTAVVKYNKNTPHCTHKKRKIVTLKRSTCFYTYSHYRYNFFFRTILISGFQGKWHFLFFCQFSALFLFSQRIILCNEVSLIKISQLSVTEWRTAQIFRQKSAIYSCKMKTHANIFNQSGCVALKQYLQYIFCFLSGLYLYQNLTFLTSSVALPH